MLDHQTHIQQHADRDEKQPQQDIAKRFDVLFHLMLVFGFGNQHACDKCAQGQRQAGAFGNPRGRQRDQQQIQHEQLLRATPHHDLEPAPHQFLAEEQQQRQQQHCFAASPSQRRQQVAGMLTERRYDNQQRHQRQVLKQQNADDAASVLGFQLHSFR